MNTTHSAGAHSTEYLLSRIDDLNLEWDRLVNNDDGTVRVRSGKVNGKREQFDVTVSALLIGYCAHVMQLSQSIRLLLEHGHIVQAIPLVRFAYETSLKQNWVYATGSDAPRAISNQYGNSRTALSDTMRKSGVRVLTEAADSIAGLGVDKLPTTSLEQASKVFKMVEDFHNGEDLYAYYRMLSEYSHPSVTVADLYLHKDDRGNPLPGFSSSPSEFPSDYLAYFTVVSCCRAMWAFATTMSDHKAKNPVRRIAKDCEVGLKMDLSVSARKRLSSKK